MITTFSIGILVSMTISCAGSSSKMTQNHMEKDYVGKPIKHALVLVIIDNQEIRKIFEKHFADWLNVKGVQAVVSAGLLPVNEDTKLEKEEIRKILDLYENDTLLITNLVEFGESEVFSRDRPQFFYNYYGHYNYSLGYVYWPTAYDEKVQITLETRLYDVNTESVIWSGQSVLKNPKTTGEAIGQVVKMVIQDLEKNGLLPEKQ